MYYSPLPQRGLIGVSGDDRISFLQGLASNDVTRASEKNAVYAALLSPQGKFLHDFFLVGDGLRILIDTDKTRTDELLQRLSMYKLRSKVTLEKLPAMGVIAAWGNHSEGIGFSDPRLPALGYRLIGDTEALAKWCEQEKWVKKTPANYEQMRLDLGIPESGKDIIPEKSFLLECRFDDLHGVDFTKGCYVGQEVTARSKYRGQVKKYLYQVRGELPEPGTPIYYKDVPAGEMRSHANGIGIALLRVEELEKAHAQGEDLQAAGKPLKVAVPAWAAA